MGAGEQYGVSKLFPPCSTKLDMLWLRVQRKISFTHQHLHILSQHSVVVQWEMPSGTSSFCKGYSEQPLIPGRGC